MSYWAALLDRLDDGLGSTPPVLLDALPGDLGPIPPALGPRAVHTLARMTELVASMEQQRADVAAELIALSAARAAATANTARSVPHFLDARA
jgi:hypothetical protein